MHLTHTALPTCLHQANKMTFEVHLSTFFAKVPRKSISKPHEIESIDAFLQVDYETR